MPNLEDEHDVQPEDSGKPFCPKCGSTDIRASHSHKSLDFFLRSFSLMPYRCRSCRKRFYKREKAEVLDDEEPEAEQQHLKE